MTFDPTEWKSQIVVCWREWAGDTKGAMSHLGVKSAYGLLVASAWLPLVSAYAREVGPAIAALTGLTAGVGTQLIANIVQRKYGEKTAAKEIEELAERDPQVRAEFDALLEELSVVQTAQQQLGESWDMFLARLRVDLHRIDSPRVQAIVDTDGGAYVGGDVDTQGGDFIGRDKVTVQPGAIYASRVTVALTGDKAKDTSALERRYLEWVFSRCSPLQLRGIDPRAISAGQDEALALWAVYVALDTTMVVPEQARFESAHKIIAAMSGIPTKYVKGAGETDKVRVVSVLEAINGASRAVLIGAPGSGKSTFLNYTALCLAGARMGDSHWLSPLQPVWTHGAMLPVCMELRDFAARGIPPDTTKGRAQMLWDYLALDLQAAGVGRLIGHVQELAGRTGAVFMLDGLDEVPEGYKRDRVREAVDEFAMTSGRKSRIIVTARPYAYSDPDHRLSGFADPFTLAPFSDKHITKFVNSWYSALEKAGWISAQVIQEKAWSLLNAAKRSDLRPIAERPLLLTLMATLHSSRGTLPDDRADLYNDVVELLLLRWNETKDNEKGLLDALEVPTLKMPDIRRKIEQVAFEAHEAQGHSDGPADVDGDDIIRAFRPLLDGSRDKAARVIEYVEKRAGLLVGLGEKAGHDRYAFPHRSFQEYLAGCYLAGLDDFRTKAAEKVRAAPTQWREVFILGARHARSDRGVPATDTLIHSLSVSEFIDKYPMTDENQWRCAIVAGLALLEIGRAVISSDPSSAAVRDRVISWLRRLIETPGLLSMPDRIEAGDALGRLGDPRFPIRSTSDSTQYILPPTVKVEAGPFEMGSNRREPDAYEEEYSATTSNNRHVVDLPEFWIGRHPVTQIEYRCFVRATGRDAPGHWIGGDMPPGLESHPVVNVSWWDALAYCAWLSKVSGQTVRPPTEAEWEKAARWDPRAQHSRIYPWGNIWYAGRCNTAEEGLRSTTPVGIYPHGASASGSLDMAGNVWEWTSSAYRTYPYDPDDGREDPASPEPRVLRGGSWFDSRTLARCAFRNATRTDHRTMSIGFRVMCSPG